MLKMETVLGCEWAGPGWVGLGRAGRGWAGSKGDVSELSEPAGFGWGGLPRRQG
jgi:hypothetical protein